MIFDTFLEEWREEGKKLNKLREKKFPIPEINKFIRNIRVHREENLTVMGRKLGIPTSFLSRIEKGKTEVTEDFLDIFLDTYKLNTTEEQAYFEIIQRTRKED